MIDRTRALRSAFWACISTGGFAAAAEAQLAPPAPPASAASAPGVTLPTVTISASADASAGGLSPPYAGGQVAHGGRAGILGTRDNMETPFSITSYTNDLIQDQQAKSVGDVLQNDSSVRTARGFGNFQESYYIRGFLLSSDDVAYNGLYSLLPRQYIATELFERVEVLRGASTFLNGVSPGGDGIGGAINLLPKRATNEPLTRATVGIGPGSEGFGSIDIGRRFGPENATGVRFNAAYRDGNDGIDNEKAKLGLLALGLDWHSRDVRLSGDLGFQDNRLRQTRTNVSLGFGVTAIPTPPDASSNFAQPWSYSNERDLFGTLRGEWDITSSITASLAYGLRRSTEGNSLANLEVDNASTGAASTYRFDNTRKDRVDTGELGLRGKLRTGPIGNEWVVSLGVFRLDKKNAYAFDFFNQLATNLYTPTSYPQPPFSSGAFYGNTLDSPQRTNVTRLTSVAIGDTLSTFDDRLLVTLGLRHQKLDVTDYAYTTGTESDSYDKSRNSPMAGVVYRISKQISVYGNYIEGLTQGDIAPSFGDPPPNNLGQALPPYVSRQKEVGVKFDGGTIGGGLALFSTTRPRAFIDSSNNFVVGGEDRHRGVELNFFGRLTQDLRWLGGATWLDAEQKSTGSASVDGKRVIGVPRTQANLGLDWDVPGLAGLAAEGRVVYTGSRYADDLNTLRVASWTRFDLGARYVTDIAGRLVTLRGRVDNVANRSYWASVGGYPDAGYLVLANPRTFTFSASVDF